MICKYEGQILSAVAHEPGFAVSTVNTIVKAGVHIKEHVKRTAVMKLMITNKCESAISEMEKRM
jgi:hypothetical protein